MPLQIEKHKNRIRCKDYLEWQHESRCCLKCGAHPIQSHHSNSKKWANGSDLLCVPLCAECHGKTSSKENFTFEIIQLQGAYIRDRGIKLGGKTLESYLLNLGMAECNDGSKKKNRRPFKKKFEAYF